MITLKKQGVRWELVDGSEPVLDQILATTGKVVKETPTKLVTSHRLGDRTYYLKRYINCGVRFRPLKYLFKQSEGRKEWNIAQRYVQLNIPLVAHLAVGERWTLTGLQESLLLTEGFDGLPLSRSHGLDRRPDVQIAVAKLLRQMHDAGIFQPDLHHNILVRVDPIELRRIDVDRGEFSPTLTDAKRIENLAWFNVSIPLSDEFFAAYRADAELIRRIQQRSRVMRYESREKYSWRCVGDNSRFATMQFGVRTWHVRKAQLTDELRQVLASPDHATEAFTVRKLDHALEAYRIAYHLELLGIPTPLPLAGTQQYYVTERVTGSPTRADAPLLAQLQSDGFTGDVECVRTADERLLIVTPERLTYRRPDQST